MECGEERERPLRRESTLRYGLRMLLSIVVRFVM